MTEAPTASGGSLLWAFSGPLATWPALRVRGVLAVAAAVATGLPSPGTGSLDAWRTNGNATSRTATTATALLIPSRWRGARPSSLERIHGSAWPRRTGISTYL